jgi:hypothetical protein
MQYRAQIVSQCYNALNLKYAQPGSAELGQEIEIESMSYSGSSNSQDPQMQGSQDTT